MEILLAAGAGLGLAAACGFRVFVPLLVMSVAVNLGKIDPAPGFDWIGTWPALVTFAIATAAEVGAYYVPWIDNLLDTITTPGALVAGTVTAAAVMPDMHPVIQWSAAVIAGGGTAGVVQIGTVITRALSSATTGGLGNPAVSTIEAGGSLFLSILALALPAITLIIVVLIMFFCIRRIYRWIAHRRAQHAAANQITP